MSAWHCGSFLYTAGVDGGALAIGVAAGVFFMSTNLDIGGSSSQRSAGIPNAQNSTGWKW